MPGNIGPVADALLAELGPAVGVDRHPGDPAAGRTMHRGHLFVGDRLLSESSLAHHPLTPMRDPDLVRVLGRQTRARVAVVRDRGLCEGPEALSSAVSHDLRAEGVRHILVDAVEDSDLDCWRRRVADPSDAACSAAPRVSPWRSPGGWREGAAAVAAPLHRPRDGG